MQSYWIIWLIVFVMLMIAQRNSAVNARIHQRKRKGVKRRMPEELLKEFIGKRCSVYQMGGSFSQEGTITAVEGNWVRFETKKDVQLLNGDMIQNIRLLPEKK